MRDAHIPLHRLHQVADGSLRAPAVLAPESVAYVHVGPRGRGRGLGVRPDGFWKTKVIISGLLMVCPAQHMRVQLRIRPNPLKTLDLKLD